MTKPKIFLWDIETGYLSVNTHDLKIYGGYLSHKQIIQDSYIISAAFKELRVGETWSVDISDTAAWEGGNFTNDEELIYLIRENLEGIDYLIHHNGDRFDLPFLNARLAHWGIEPLPPTITLIDTCKIAKKHFRFSSNSLEYLAKTLGVTEKGFCSGGNWRKAQLGDTKAVKSIAAYNEQDVETLEEVFEVLVPYTKSKINFNHWSDEECCPNCGSKHFQRRGIRYTKTRAYQQYQCKGCFSFFSRTISDRGVKLT